MADSTPLTVTGIHFSTASFPFPTEIFVEIFSYLSVPDLLRLRIVSRQLYKILSDNAMWHRAVWPSFRRKDAAMLTVFLSLSHKSLRSLYIGGDLKLAHVTRLRRLTALKNLVISTNFDGNQLTSMIGKLPKVSHLTLSGPQDRWLQQGIQQLVLCHPQLQSFTLVPSNLFVFTGMCGPIQIISEWASNGFKPACLTVETYYKEPDITKLYLQQHRCITSQPPPQHSATFRCFQRVRGLLDSSIEPPYLQINLGPKTSPLDAAVSSLPADVGKFQVLLGRSRKNQMVARAINKSHSLHVPEELSVSFSQCGPVLSYLNLSYTSLQPGALTYLSQHCPQLLELVVAHAQVPDLVEGLYSLAEGCKWLCGINLRSIDTTVDNIQSFWEAIYHLRSLKYLCLDGCMLMPSRTPKINTRELQTSPASGVRWRYSHVPNIDAEACEEMMKILEQLRRVTAVHITDCYHCDHLKNFSSVLIHNHLLSAVIRLRNLRYLKIDLNSNNSIYRCKLVGFAELLRSCTELRCVTIDAYDMEQPADDPSLFSRLTQLQLKMRATSITNDFSNALMSACKLRVLCAQFASFPPYTAITLVNKLDDLEVCHITTQDNLIVSAISRFKKAAKDHPKSPIDAFLDNVPRECFHPEFSDLWN